MAIEVRPIQPEDLDGLRRCAAVEGAAFAGNAISPLVFPGPFPEDANDKRAKELAEQSGEKGVGLYMAVDTDVEGPDAILGWSKWEIFDDALPKPKPRNFGPGTNKEAAAMMFGAIDGLRERHMSGKPCAYLHILVVNPDQQGRGVGKKLLAAGQEEAARRGLPAYLESTEAGRPLYQKGGFEDIEYVEVSFEKFDFKEPFKTWAMIWNAPKQ